MTNKEQKVLDEIRKLIPKEFLTSCYGTSMLTYNAIRALEDSWLFYKTEVERLNGHRVTNREKERQELEYNKQQFLRHLAERPELLDTLQEVIEAFEDTDLVDPQKARG